MSQRSLSNLLLVAVAALSAGTAGFVGWSEAHRASQSGTPQSATSADDVAALRAELSSLRRRLQAESATRMPAAEDGGEVVRGSAVRSEIPPAPPPPKELSFEREKVDPTWARAAEEDVRGFLEDYRGLSVEKLECRTSSCRALFTAADMLQTQRVFVEAPAKLGAQAAMGSSVPGKSDTFEVTFVLPRDDEG